MTHDERATDASEDRGRSSRGRSTPEPRVVSRRPARGTEKSGKDEAPSTAEEPRGDARSSNGGSEGGTRRRRRRSDSSSRSEAPAEAITAAPARQPSRSSEPTRRDEPLGDMATELRSVLESLDDLNRRVARMERQQRLGVFVDVPNLIYGAERSDEPIHMGKLLDMLSEGRELIRATAYSPVSDDPGEPVERQKFVAPFVPFEYRIVTKPLKRFADGSIKGNFDVEMAVDMVTMAERLDVICIVSGDADFARVVEVIQSRGVRVEVAAFANSTSAEMRAIADHYLELGTVVRDLR